MRELKDKKGNVIREFDLLKIFHFTAALRRERRYMYKWVRIKNGELYGMHLADDSGDSFPLWSIANKETFVVEGAEIVQTFYS